MGEKIKSLATVIFRGAKLEIELNHPPSGKGEEHVHIQTENFRLELTRSAFIKYAATILKAESNLKGYKKL